MPKLRISWREKLKAEGHTIEEDKAGKPKRVRDWEEKLVGV
jgi:hypothetical protein